MFEEAHEFGRSWIELGAQIELVFGRAQALVWRPLASGAGEGARWQGNGSFDGPTLPGFLATYL